MAVDSTRVLRCRVVEPAAEHRLLRLDVLAEVSDGGATVHLLARLTAEAEPSAERPPVNLALVIDRSSSMRGPRFAQAVRAATQVVDRLDARDRLTILAFDGSVRVVFGPERVTPEAAATLARALAELETGVGTNLAGAIKAGAERIRAGYVRGGLSRLVLLTDGQPSVGITDGEKLCSLVEAEWHTGVTVTAMGIGESFEDELLAEMARRGRGGFHYLATPADIPAAFGRELAGLFAIAATQAELKLVPHEHVTAVDLLHRLPSRPVDDGLVVEVGEVAAGAPRLVLFRVARDPDSESRHLITARLTYRTADGRPGDGSIIGIELPRMPAGGGSARGHARALPPLGRDSRRPGLGPPRRRRPRPRPGRPPRRRGPHPRRPHPGPPPLPRPRAPPRRPDRSRRSRPAQRRRARKDPPPPARTKPGHASGPLDPLPPPAGPRRGVGNRGGPRLGSGTGMGTSLGAATEHGHARGAAAVTAAPG